MAKSKHTVYIPDDIFDEISAHAERLDRSPSWMLIHAWSLARQTISRYESMNPTAVAERARELH